MYSAENIGAMKKVSKYQQVQYQVLATMAKLRIKLYLTLKGDKPDHLPYGTFI